MEAKGEKRSYTFRVRYAETDQMGVAHHSNYFVWFEAGRSDYCRDLGVPYPEWERHGVFLPVVEARCRYKSPLRYDELATLEVFPVEPSPSAIICATPMGNWPPRAGRSTPSPTPKAG